MLTQIFTKLQNTATAAYFTFLGVCIVPAFYDDVYTLEDVERLRVQFDVNLEKASTLHPSVDAIHKWDVVNPLYQVRGTWTQLTLAEGSMRPCPRYSPATFMYDGKLYVCGGQRSQHKAGGWKPIYDFW